MEELLFIKPQELFIGRQGTQNVHNNYVKLFLKFDWFLLSDLLEDRHVDDVIALFCFFVTKKYSMLPFTCSVYIKQITEDVAMW